MDTLINTIEWTGSLLAIVGALLLARRPDFGVRAYLIMLVASVFLTLFGLLSGHYGVATMNAAFVLTNLVGLQRRLRDAPSPFRVLSLFGTKP